jgi:hypothetical protein
MSNRDERGYEVPYEGQNHVTRVDRGAEVTLDMNEDGLEVRIERRHGYIRESRSTFVHMDVLLRMLDQAGYAVTKR